MPKSVSNTRPYNRTQKKETKRIKDVMPRASRALGNASYMGVGPGRMYNSSGVAAQALRDMAMEADKKTARKIAPKRGTAKKKK